MTHASDATGTDLEEMARQLNRAATEAGCTPKEREVALRLLDDIVGTTRQHGIRDAELVPLLDLPRAAVRLARGRAPLAHGLKACNATVGKAQQPESDMSAVNAEIARSDDKSGHLLTGLSIPLAVLVAAVPGRDLSGAPGHFVGLGTVGLVTAMIMVLLVIRPRLRGYAHGSFLHWAAFRAEDLVTDPQSAQGASEHTAHRNRLARIARTKYRLVRGAVDCTMASLVALAVGLLLDKI